MYIILISQHSFSVLFGYRGQNFLVDSIHSFGRISDGYLCYIILNVSSELYFSASTSDGVTEEVFLELTFYLRDEE